MHKTEPLPSLAQYTLLLNLSLTMLKLVLKLILPLTVISFVSITKWWQAKIQGEFGEILHGFPLPYVCPGWHTSMSLQIFLAELVFDFSTYFLFWLLIIGGLHRFVAKINVHRIVAVPLIGIASLTTLFLILMLVNPDNIFYVKRPNSFKVLESGFWFFWDR